MLPINTHGCVTWVLQGTSHSAPRTAVLDRGVDKSISLVTDASVDAWWRQTKRYSFFFLKRGTYISRERKQFLNHVQGSRGSNSPENFKTRERPCSFSPVIECYWKIRIQRTRHSSIMGDILLYVFAKVYVEIHMETQEEIHGKIRVVFWNNPHGNQRRTLNVIFQL